VGPDKRGDELAVSVVLNAADGLHLLQDGRHRREGLRQLRFCVADMSDVRCEDQRHKADELIAVD